MAWGCTCWANSAFGNVCTISAILGPNGHFGTHLQSRTPTCLTCAITNLLFADNCMASEEDMRHFVWQGGCIYSRVECVHTCTAPWSCCAVAWLPKGMLTGCWQRRHHKSPKSGTPFNLVRIQKFLWVAICYSYGGCGGSFTNGCRCLVHQISESDFVQGKSKLHFVRSLLN